MIKRLFTLLITVFIILTLTSCGNDTSESNIYEKDIIDDVDNTAVEMNDDVIKNEEKTSSYKRSDLLPNTYKIPLIEVYVDTPNFSDIGSGYTELFKDGDTKYVAFTDSRKETMEDAKEVFDNLYPQFKNNVKSWHRIKGDPVLTESSVEINGITTHKIVGTVECGITTSTDCYIYGYSFIFEDVPCSIIGVVSDKAQPQEEIDELTAIVDAMMESVRNEQ